MKKKQEGLFKFVCEHTDDLTKFLDYIKVGVFVADGEGNVLLLNQESEKTGGMQKEQLIGKNMVDLIEEGYVEESTVTEAIKTGEENNLIQKLGDGGQVYITGAPVFDQNQMSMVICTERDITETIELRKLLEENREMTTKYKKELESLKKIKIYHETGIITNSYAFRSVIDRAIRISGNNATVLITGESGTGKEMIANLIVENSMRADKPFIKVNCAAIPENLLESEFFGYEEGSFTGASKSGKIGFFESANTGTLFLDEIGELPISLQAKLLRVLQEKVVTPIGATEETEIDVRIIAATNKDLQKAIQEDEFREDLYYRLNVFPLEIPPLRARKEDIKQLVQHFISYFNSVYKTQKTIKNDAISALEEHDWPGNVRELRNAVERLVLETEDFVINKFQVQKQITNKTKFVSEIDNEHSLFDLLEDYEEEIITDLMNQYDSVSKVASILKVNKSTISRKWRKYNS